MVNVFLNVQSFWKNVKAGLNLSNSVTTSDVKKEILAFAQTNDLTSLKSGVDEVDIDKLKTAFTKFKQF